MKAAVPPADRAFLSYPRPTVAEPYPCIRKGLLLIPRLFPQSIDSRRRLSWTETCGEPPLALFDGHRHLRKLRVLLDADLWPTAESGQFTMAEVLAGLLSHPSVELWRFSDDGPPPALLSNSADDGEVPPGWAEIFPRGDLSFGDGVLDVRVGLERGVAFYKADRGLMHLVASRVPDESGENADNRRRLLDGRAATVAVAVDADLFITGRDHLLSSDRHLSSCRFASVAEGIAIVGLYLRQQHQPVIYRHFDFNGQVNAGRHEFYWAGARDCLPGSWRWLSVFDKQSKVKGDDSAYYAAESAVARVQQALEARDRIHVAMNGSRSNSSNDEMASGFDILALMLLAALDAAAAAISSLFGLPANDNPTFGNKKWIKEAGMVCEPVTDLFRDGSDGWRVLKALKILRNTIHHAALTTIAVQDADNPRDRLAIRLPRSFERELHHYFNHLGGLESWGVRHVADGLSFADPAVLADRLVAAVVHFLNRVMESLPVESLSGVMVSPDETVPRSVGQDTPYEAFSPSYLNCIRWQLAVDPFITPSAARRSGPSLPRGTRHPQPRTAPRPHIP